MAQGSSIEKMSPQNFYLLVFILCTFLILVLASVLLTSEIWTFWLGLLAGVWFPLLYYVNIRTQRNKWLVFGVDLLFIFIYNIGLNFFGSRLDTNPLTFTVRDILVGLHLLFASLLFACISGLFTERYLKSKLKASKTHSSEETP